MMQCKQAIMVFFLFLTAKFDEYNLGTEHVNLTNTILILSTSTCENQMLVKYNDCDREEYYCNLGN